MALLWNCLQQVRDGAPKIHAAPVAGTAAAAERGIRAAVPRASAESAPHAGPARQLPVSNRRKETAA